MRSSFTCQQHTSGEKRQEKLGAAAVCRPKAAPEAQTCSGRFQCTQSPPPLRAGRFRVQAGCPSWEKFRGVSRRQAAAGMQNRRGRVSPRQLTDGSSGWDITRRVIPELGAGTGGDG